jgi:alcohol dehydrogenase, propanol-preferring
MTEATMDAWVVERPGPIDHEPLRRIRRPIPVPAPGEVRVRVSTCGVCRTDVHVACGELAVHRPRVVPGHEVVGYVETVGADTSRFSIGDRVGIAWLRHTCGVCRFCTTGRENLCLTPRFTGWDDDGGYAQYAVVPEAFAYHLPDRFDDVTAAPLLCAGIIGFRALERAHVPPGGVLGIYGFGGSAHLTAQLALHRGHTVHVMTRSAGGRQLALALGCASAARATDAPPEPLDAAILFAPAGELVPVALRALDRGGTLAIAGIHLSTIPPVDYASELFHERELRSVTANTRIDGERFLEEAADADVRVHTVRYPMADADRALADLWHDRVDGAAVLEADVVLEEASGARGGGSRP